MSIYRDPAKPYQDRTKDAADLAQYTADLRRSQVRRDRIVTALKWAGGALVVSAIVVFFVLLGVWAYRKQAACEARGGIYLWREGKCVPGFKQHRPGSQ